MRKLWFDASLVNAEDFSSEVSVYRKDTNTHGVGVLIFAHNSLQSTVICPNIHNSAEPVWSKVAIRNGAFFMVGLFFIPPSSSVPSLQEVSDTLLSVGRECLIISGDSDSPDVH